MRRDIVHIGAGELTYAIREIVDRASEIQRLGVAMSWENIGDPVAKGQRIPGWVKDIVAELVRDDSCSGYCSTRGELGTREFLADRGNGRDGAQITAEDILFFNGIGLNHIHITRCRIYSLCRSTWSPYH